MWISLMVGFCYVANYLHAENISNSITTSNSTVAPNATNLSSQLSEIDKELYKIESDCFNARDYEHLTGDNVKSSQARIISYTFIEQGVAVTGLQELRAALKLDPPGPWKHYNSTEPSEKELESASIEEYYNLKEPISHYRTLDNDYLFEHNIVTAVKFFDKRLPSIRIVFRKTFQEKMSSASEVLDKKTVDDMIETFNATHKKVEDSMRKLHGRDHLCWEDHRDNLKNRN